MATAVNANVRLRHYDKRRRFPDMRRSPPVPGGNLEYAVLVALWDLKQGSAREIYSRVGEPNGLVYTTVAKVLDRLLAKKLVVRERKGMAFTYRPRVSREIVERARARRSLAGLFGAEPRPAMAALVEAVESLDPDLLDELESAVKRRRRSRGP